MALAGTGLAVVAVALVPAAMVLGQAGSSTSNVLDLGPLDQRSYVYASDGSLLATLRAEIDRQPIPLEEIPRQTIDAVLAVEDAEFYIHDGVNLRATLRALVRNVDEGEAVQGGSTITQQLVKAELVGDADTIDRKAREAILARRLEDEMSKAEILERYLNTVYFGNGAYGIQAGAETYFGIDAKDLDDGQSAFLAGMIGNPAAFDPVRHPAESRARRNIALERMVAIGYLAPERAEVLRDEPVPSEISQIQPTPDTYFVEEVKQQLLDDRRLGETRQDRANALFRGGLRIHTTLDPKAQQQAEKARDDVLAGISPEGTPVGTTPINDHPKTGEPRSATAAVVSVDPATGAVRAMIGGPSFADAQVNIATGRGVDGVGRSGGSTFKIFVLLALLENGYVPTDTVNGTGPCQFTNIPGLDPDPYPVENFDNAGGSVGTILEQTLRSSNCAFVRLGQIVGTDEVIEQAKRMGISTTLREVASLPLGTNEVFPVEMAEAVAAIAADGMRADPYYVERIEDQDGRTIYEHDVERERAMTPQSARLAAEVLEANVRSGTGTRARIPGQHAMGKTGTGQESSDAWFVGATPYLATAVWLGSPDDNERVVIQGRGITGGNIPAEIWGRYMREWHEGKPTRDFREPGPTRAGRFLQLPPDVDTSPTTTSSTLPLDFPFPFPLPGGTFPTLPPGYEPPFPTSPTRPPDGGPSPPSTRFPPGFPFDD